MPCTVESASLEPKYGLKFVAGGEDMWIRVFNFHTGEELGMCSKLSASAKKKNSYVNMMLRILLNFGSVKFS